MNMINRATRQSIVKYRRQIVISLAAVAILGWTAIETTDGMTAYVSGSPTITQTFTNVYTEDMLIDFCYRIQSLPGVTGVSIRDFDSGTQRATVTVFYDEHHLSYRQIRVFLNNSRVLWQTQLST